MNCVKCGSPTPYSEQSLCYICEEAAIATLAEFRRLFVDSAIARDTKKIIKEDEQ